MEGVRGYSILAARITQVTYNRGRDSLFNFLNSGNVRALSKILIARWLVSCLYFFASQRFMILSA
jgi:hypothetical protein